MKRIKIKGIVYSCLVNPRNILSNKLRRESERKSLHTALDFDIKHSSVVLIAKIFCSIGRWFRELCHAINSDPCEKTATKLVFNPEKCIRRKSRASRIYYCYCFHWLYGNISWLWKMAYWQEDGVVFNAWYCNQDYMDSVTGFCQSHTETLSKHEHWNTEEAEAIQLCFQKSG